MLEIKSREEFIRALKANDVVFIEYYDSSSDESKLFYDVMRELVKHIDPRILVLRIDARRYPELSKDVSHVPCLRIYYRGEIIFEQQGLFGIRDLDLYVLRRSIRSVFSDMNIAFKV